MHAPLELQQARSKEVQQKLKFSTTLGSNITLPQRFLDYADVTSTIAYAVLIYGGNQQKPSRFSKDISYLWSMQSDLHMRRKRFAHCLASTLFGIDFNAPKLHLGIADFEFLAAVKVPDKQFLKPLIQAGLTQEMLDPIASLVLVKKGLFQPIAEYFDSVKFNR
ncbi:hypothetical protein EON65_12950 [archaeon]|nr:MAG: hypothetical protein EON65_12950 [archaeon]